VQAALSSILRRPLGRPRGIDSMCGNLWDCLNAPGIPRAGICRAPVSDRCWQRPLDAGAGCDCRLGYGLRRFSSRLTIRGLEATCQPMVGSRDGAVWSATELAITMSSVSGSPSGATGSSTRTDVLAILPGLFLELGWDLSAETLGAFAIAIWDPRCRTLALARDSHRGTSLVFHCSWRGDPLCD